MAVFKYKLQNVLDIKFRMEDQAKAEFAASMQKLDEEEQKKAELVARKKAYEEEGKRLRESTLNVQKLKDNSQAVDHMKELISQQELNVVKARNAVELMRRKLTEAVMERKIHEKLKENSFDEFKREINAAESKEIDELVSYTYGERIKKNNNEE